MLPLIIHANCQKTEEIIQKLAVEHEIKNPNIFEIRPLKEEITINQIRELKTDLSTIQTEKRMIVFFDFDKSGMEAQNSLLKILEEKIEKNLFVFLVSNAEKIIETIKSRAKIVSFQLKKKGLKYDLLIEKIIVDLKKKIDLGFLNKKELVATTKEGFLNLSDKLLIYFKKELRNEKESQKAVKISKKILLLTRLVANNNLNPQLALDNLLIFIWKNLNIELHSSKVAK